VSQYSAENIKKRRQRLLGLIILVVILMSFVGDRVVKALLGERRRQQLVKELRRIQPPLSASFVDRLGYRRNYHSVIGAEYDTTVPFPEIRHYYADEMESQGWHLIQERGDATRFCKGKLEAELAPMTKTTGASYALFMWEDGGCI
jgi:hypothetical protein